MSTEVTQAPRTALGDTERKQRVRDALKAVGSSQRECCTALRLSDATVSRVVAGLQRSAAVEEWILAKTGKSRADLFDGAAAVGAGNAVE